MATTEEKPKVQYVDLGKELNHLLNHETRLGESKQDQCGLELPTPGKRGGGMNIVVLSGSPGSGKSTLALQILTAAARQGFDSIHLSLEDHPKATVNKAKTFNWDPFLYLPEAPPDEPKDEDSDSSDAFDTYQAFAATIEKARCQVAHNVPPAEKEKNPEKIPGAIITAALLPRPVSAKVDRTKDFFLEQYHYLETLIKNSAKHAKKHHEVGKRVPGIRIVVIDSLSMLSYSGQTRESLFRVFDLFRANGIMGVFTVDGGPLGTDAWNPAISFDSTMADVVFGFSSKLNSAYLVHYISVEKSRYTATSYGLHPCKINRTEGIRVFPSLHAIIAATQPPAHENPKEAFPFGWGDKLTAYVVRSSLKRPGVVALHGPHGTRKSLMAINFLTHGLVGNLIPANKTIMESGILIRLKDPGDNSKFSGIPAYPEMNYKLQCQLTECKDSELSKDFAKIYGKGNKAEVKVFGVNGTVDTAVLVVVDFNTGMLFPEEFVDIVQRIFEKVNEQVGKKNPGQRVRRVVLDDVSVIGGVSYPLLEKSETTADLFLSVFVHVMRNKQVDLMLVGTRGNLVSGNVVVDRAIALADAVVETKIKDIFGDRYVLLAGDGAMAQENQFKEYVPPALQIYPVTFENDSGRPMQAHLMEFDIKLLRGLTGFDGPTITRTKVFAYIFKLNKLQERYNNTLPYLVEPLCGLPTNDEKDKKSGRSESGLQVIHFDPDMSDTIHRSLGVPKPDDVNKGRISASRAYPPKEHTVLATIDEFEMELKKEPYKEYNKNVLFVAWRNHKKAKDFKRFKTWQSLLGFVTGFQKKGKGSENKAGLAGCKVWIDRSAKETLSCCLLDCLISGWKQAGGGIPKPPKIKRNRGKETKPNPEKDKKNLEAYLKNLEVYLEAFNRALDDILQILRNHADHGKGADPASKACLQSIVKEVTAMHAIFKCVRQNYPGAWGAYSGIWPAFSDLTEDDDTISAATKNSKPEICHTPPDADVYICWYSQLRELLARPEFTDQAEEFHVAALPAGGFKGDWKLLVLPGSVSHGLGEAVVSALTTPEEDYRRFVLGIGLPVDQRWRDSEFRAWPGASEDETLQDIFNIHEAAHLRSGIKQYTKFTRILSTFAQRLAGDWDKNGKVDFEMHLGRLPSHIDTLRK